MSANSGVNSIVSTGAMFSTTRCFDSTSHAETITAPAAPDGITHAATLSGFRPAGWTMAAVSAISTPPPSAIST